MKLINTPISMISYMDEKGEIQPIKFKIIKNNGSSQIIKINSIDNKETLNICGIKSNLFTCEVLVNEVIKKCKIKYDLIDCKWTLYQI